MQYLIKVKNNIVSQGQLILVFCYLPVRSNITMHLNNNLTQLSNLVVSQDKLEGSRQLIPYVCSTSTDSLAPSGSSDPS